MSPIFLRRIFSSLAIISQLFFAEKSLLSIFSIFCYASYFFLHLFAYFIAGDILLRLDKIPEWLEKEGCIIGSCKQEKNTYFSRHLLFCNNGQTFLKIFVL